MNTDNSEWPPASEWPPFSETEFGADKFERAVRVNSVVVADAIRSHDAVMRRNTPQPHWYEVRFYAKGRSHAVGRFATRDIADGVQDALMANGTAEQTHVIAVLSVMSRG